MRVLVCPAMMEIGGSQTNAVELAKGVADLGHDVVLFCPDGDLLDTVRNFGLQYELAPRERSWPSRHNMHALNRLVRERAIDVVHGYEWGPAIDLAFGPHLRYGVPVVTTVMSMSVPDFLPRHTPLLVGTARLRAEQARTRDGVRLMEPPIDTVCNAPGDGHSARARFGFRPDEFIVTVVGRLVTDLEKVHGIIEAISAVDALAETVPIRLLVVGDGSGLAQVRACADTVNARHGRDTILVAGALMDPRDAYDAADVVLGMGSSALKGLAFAKPLVVQGAAGFWRLLDDSSLAMFLEHGWYGARGGGAVELAGILHRLYAAPSLRDELGEFGRALVSDRFSLARASDDLVGIYSEAIGNRPSPLRSWSGLASSAVRLAKFKFALQRHRWATWRGPARLRGAQ